MGVPRQLAAVVAALVWATACGSGSDTGTDAAGRSAPGAVAEVPAACGDVEPDELEVEVVRSLPQAQDAFTQGLEVVDGELFTSTGRVGQSSVRVADLADGDELRRVEVPEVFGEGLTADADGRIWQLTWTEGIAFVRDPETLEEIARFDYDGEGWGIAALDDGRLVMSDGTNVLTVRDPGDFSVIEVWEIARSDGPADKLNELEWDGERLWANRWLTDELVRIDLDCRRVDAVADLSELRRIAQKRAGGEEIDVTNGVAHLPGTGRYLVTGKLWPVIFEVEMQPIGVGE